MRIHNTMSMCINKRNSEEEKKEQREKNGQDSSEDFHINSSTKSSAASSSSSSMSIGGSRNVTLSSMAYFPVYHCGRVKTSDKFCNRYRLVVCEM